tara:strand:- start:42785 stop:43171 length:387 start_codon:yes stop_codon:yes gene_type:complete
MKIEHLAIWTQDLEKMKAFYLQFFAVTSNEKYHNPTKQFSSYFLTFESGARIELMHKPDIAELLQRQGEHLGLAHFAISLGAKQKVDALTAVLRKNGHTIVGAPRTTGDGYYESVIADPEGNLIELTI